MRDGTCGGCGGPMVRKSCLGVCASGPRPRRKRAPRPERRPGAEAAVLVAKIESHTSSVSLSWRQEFVSERGLPLSVSVSRAYRVVAPQGHAVRVWPKAA